MARALAGVCVALAMLVVAAPAFAVDLATTFDVRFDGATAGENVGHEVESGGDVNGDGKADLLLGSERADPNGTDSGVVYVAFGNALQGIRDLSTLGATGFKIEGPTEEDGFGAEFGELGDINGDGRGDFVVGMLHFDDPVDGVTPAAYVIFGRTDGATIDLSAGLPPGAGYEIGLRSAEPDMGIEVGAVGDMNGDGLSEVTIGGEDREVFVLFGKGTDTPIDLDNLGSTQGFRADAPTGDLHFAEEISGVGDVNADGRHDLGIIDNADFSNPDAYVVFGKSTGTTLDFDALPAGYGYRIADTSANANYGSVDAAGDQNHDGRADLIIGSHRADPAGRTDAGSAWVLFGKADDATVDLATLGAGGYRIDGQSPGDRTGEEVDLAGDFDRDGTTDTVLGAEDASRNGRDQAGTAWVVRGKATTTTVDLASPSADALPFDGAKAGDAAGEASESAGDYNGDGAGDIVIGADFADFNNRSSSGSVYVIFGRALPGTPPPAQPAPPPAGDTPAPTAPEAPPQAAPKVPAPAPAPPPVSASSLFKLPSAKRCASRRSFRIRLVQPAPPLRIRSAAVFVNGKRVKTVTATRITAPVNLRALPKGRITVKIVATLSDGRNITGSRRYRTCTPKRRPGSRPRL